MARIGALFRIAQRKWSQRGTQIRFVIAGGFNTLFGLGMYPLLLWVSDTLHRHYMIALVVAQMLSLCFAFAVYKFTVFRTRHGSVGEFSRFLPFYLVNYAINWAALPLLVRLARLDPIVAQFVFSIILMISSYFWHSRITFRTSKGRS